MTNKRRTYQPRMQIAARLRAYFALTSPLLVTLVQKVALTAIVDQADNST
jgi:hypothetical protein